MYIIGAQIGGRVSFSSTDEHDEMDGELVCRYLTIIDCMLGIQLTSYTS